MKKIALVFLCIFLVSFVSAQLGFSNPKLPKLEAPTQTTTSSSSSSFNSTDFILKNGSTTTTALIPFALGWSASNPSTMLGTSALFFGSSSTQGGKAYFDSTGSGTFYIQSGNFGASKVSGAKISMSTPDGIAPVIVGSSHGGNFDIDLGDGSSNGAGANGGRMQIDTGSQAGGGTNGYVSIGTFGALTNVEDSLSVDGSLETYTDNYLYGVADGMLKLSGSKIDTAVDGTDYQGVITAVNPLFLSSNVLTINTSVFCLTNGTGCSTAMSYTNLAMTNQSNSFNSNSNNSFAGDVLINGSSATQFQIINTSSSTPFFAVNTKTGNIGIGNSPSSAQIISATQNIGTTTANQQLFTATQNINAKANNVRMFSTTQNWNWNGTAMSPSAPIGHVLFITQDNRRITSGSGDSFYNSRIQISRNSAFISSATSHNLYNQFWLIADSGTYNATSNVANKLVAINPSFNAFNIQNNLSNGANLTYDVVMLEGEILSFLPKDNTANKGAYTYTLAKTIAPNGASSVNTTGNTTIYGLDCGVAFNKTYCLYDRVGSINYIAGTLGIGTNNPNQKLHVEGNININGIIINQNASSWGNYGVCYLNSTYTTGALGHCIDALNSSGSCNCRPN